MASPPKKPTKFTGTLLVHVQSAEDLKSCDLNGFSDPYFKIICRETAKKARTDTIMKTLNPVWNESISLPVADTTELDIEVWDWDRIGSNDLCGKASFNLCDANVSTGFRTPTITIPLDTQGVVKFALEFHDRSCLFGLDIDTVCVREHASVPIIVTKCIAVIEAFGLSHRKYFVY